MSCIIAQWSGIVDRSWRVSYVSIDAGIDAGLTW